MNNFMRMSEQDVRVAQACAYNGQLSEFDFRYKIKRDTEEIMQKLDKEEQVFIGYLPLVISHLAWMYAFKVKDYAVRHKISSLRPLTRLLTQVRQRYEEVISQDLSSAHTRSIYDEAERMFNECQWDFTTLYFSVSNSLKKAHPDVTHDEMRTYAFMGIIFIDILEQHNKDADKLVEKKLGGDQQTITNPCMTALRLVLRDYVDSLAIPYDTCIQLGIKIFRKNLKKVKFPVLGD